METIRDVSLVYYSQREREREGERVRETEKRW